MDPTARPLSDSWGAVNGYDSVVGDMTTVAFQSRASQASIDAGSQYGWERVWDPRGQRNMDEMPTGVVSNNQGSSTPRDMRSESNTWSYKQATAGMQVTPSGVSLAEPPAGWANTVGN